MKTLLTRLVRDEEGQDLIEYAILIGLIAVGVIAIVASIGTWVLTQFTTLNTELQSATGGGS